MLFKLLLALFGVISSPFRADVDPYDREPYEVTPHGPKSLEEAIRASEALQGENDDILWPEDAKPSDAGTSNTRLRWDGYPGKGEVCYFLDTDVAKNQSLVNMIKAAIKQWEAKTCIRFVERTNQKDCVKIIRGSGCSSYVGKVASPQPQLLSIGVGCEYIGTIVHEFGHAIGLFHEHQRSDRDTYIKVIENNVKSDQMHNFQKNTKSDEMTFGSAYDYGSIMHYGQYAFSKKPNVLKTMEAKNGAQLKEPYERPGLNDNDATLVKKLYQCK